MGYLWLKENHEEEREKIMKSSKIYNVFSCPAEKIIGAMCMIAYLAQIILKSQTKTLIFIFNPCHAVTFCYGLVYLMPFSIVTELIVCGALGGSFGACLGLLFPENANLSIIELIFYNVQHVMAFIICPVLLFYFGRYNPKRYLQG